MTYQVGYGRPPLHTRFRKGQSGNPSGEPGPRRAMERLLRVYIEEALLAPPQTSAGLVPRDSVEAAAWQLLEAVAEGDRRAIRFVLLLLRRGGGKGRRAMRAAAPAAARPNEGSQGISA
jgi:hypothetical protein